MNDKFKYAPGKPGFGSKGDDGSVGTQGLAMYFTDLDPNAGGDSFILNDKIRNNIVLWQSSSDPLPGGRTYMIGDLFFDSEGKTYEITNTTAGTYEYRLASLNMGGFFVPLEIDTDNGFQRYFNSNLSPRYIIDNVYTAAGAINYTESPLNIYGIEPKNFARIEYSNVIYTIGLNEYNPFTVYSSGETAGFDDASSLAIVRDNIHNSFRIGNLDDVGNIRNVNLIFDVSSLIHTKQPGNYFNVATSAGSILTNYEIKANAIFDPNFNSSPGSFFASMGTTDISLNWNLSHFTNDPLVTGDLYFFEQLGTFTSASFRIDSSAARPLIFSNVTQIGSIRITGISPTKVYGCYMKLSKNGWVRNSAIKYAFLGNLYVSPPFYSDTSSGASTIGFDVSTNFTWNASIWQNQDNFMTLGSCPSTLGLDGSIFISVIPNDTSHNRIGKFRVSLVPGGSPYQDITITHPAGVVLPVLTLHGSNLYGYGNNYYRDVSQNGQIGFFGLGLNVSTNAGNPWSSVHDAGLTMGFESGVGPVNPNYINCTPNNTMTLEERGITFTYGGASTVYLGMRVEPVESWWEFTYSGGTQFPWDFLSTPLEFDNAGDPVGPSGFNGILDLKFTNGVAIPWTITLPSPNPLGISFSQLSGTGDANYIYVSVYSGAPAMSDIVEANLGGTIHSIRIQKNY